MVVDGVIYKETNKLQTKRGDLICEEFQYLK